MCETCLLLVITEIDARFDIRIRIRIREAAKPLYCPSEKNVADREGRGIRKRKLAARTKLDIG